MAYTPSRPGKLSADDRALFYKKFSGEVLKAFEQKNVFANLVWNKTITSGKSAGFPIIQDSSDPTILVPGTEISSDVIANEEKTILIDGLVVGSTLITDIDAWMSEYEVDSIYAQKLAYQMAKTVDHALAAELVKSALNGSNSVDIATQSDTVADVSASELVDAIFKAAEKLDENNVTDTGRYLAVAPKVYYKLFGYLSAIDKDYAGNGSIATGKIIELAGFTIVKTNTLKNALDVTTSAVEVGADLSADTGDAKSIHKFSVVANTANSAGLLAVAFVMDAAAMLKLKDMAFEKARDIKAQGDWIVTKMAAGFGDIRNESAVIIKDSDATVAAVTS